MTVVRIISLSLSFPFPIPPSSSHRSSLVPHLQEVDQRWSEYQARFSSLLQWSRQHMALMANKNFPQNPVELKVRNRG